MQSRFVYYECRVYQQKKKRRRKKSVQDEACKLWKIVNVFSFSFRLERDDFSHDGIIKVDYKFKCISRNVNSVLFLLGWNFQTMYKQIFFCDS